MRDLTPEAWFTLAALVALVFAAGVARYCHQQDQRWRAYDDGLADYRAKDTE